MPAKKKEGKKKKESEPTESSVVQEEVLMTTTELEPEPEEVQFTDTSYTSASLESLPPIPVEDPKVKKKKKKKLGEKTSSVVRQGSIEFERWSDISIKPPWADLLQKPEEAVVDKKKKKKGKKGKKEKKEEEIPEFDKPKAWKKMNKKDRDAWLVQRIEEWRLEKEAEKQARLAGAKEKRAAMARERIEAMAREVAEQDIRRDLLQKCVNLFHSYETQKMSYEHRKTEDAEWQQYLRCDGLPDPRVVTEMSTFIHLWQENKKVDDDELDKKFIEVLPILEMLEIFRRNPRQFTPRQLENYEEIRVALRAQLSSAIQMASYTLLRNLEKHLVFESTKVATYHRDFEGLRLNIWVAIKWPTRKPKPVEPDPEPVELSFPSMKVAVKLPTIIDGSCVCVRAARSLIDLLSESSRSFALLADIPNRYEDLFTFNVKELIDCQKLKKIQDEVRNKFFKENRERIKEIENFLKTNIYAKVEKEKEELDALNMAEPPYMPWPRQQMAFENEKAFEKYLKSCRTRIRIGELNLRQYRICGGVLNLDLIVTPPQPKRMRHSIFITTYLHVGPVEKVVVFEH